MSEGRGTIMLAAIVALAAWAATSPPVTLPPKPQEQAVRIEAQKHPEYSPRRQTGAENETAARNGTVTTDHQNGGAEEGTEYWPPLLGVRLKITDSLLALFTLLLVVVGGAQSRLLKKTISDTAAAASTANRTARDAIAAANRPWLAVEVSDGRGVKWDEKGMTLTIGLKIVNYGNSPAHKVWVMAEGYLAGTPDLDIGKVTTSLSLAVSQGVVDRLNAIIFKGKDSEEFRQFAFTNEQIGIADDRFSKIWRGPVARKGHAVIIIGAVGYEMPFSGRRHTTTFEWAYFRKGDSQLSGFDRAAGDVAESDIATFVRGSTAN
jgi:hypothetical protein